MRKLIMICVAITILSGCTNSDYDIRYKNVSEIPIVEHDFSTIKGVYGYIMDIDTEKALVVGMNVNDEHDQLNATYVNLEYAEILDNDIEIGTKVRYVTDGVTFTSYPSFGGIKVIEILKRDVLGAKSSEVSVIQKSLEVLKELNDRGSLLLYSVNDIVFEDDIWEVRIVEDNGTEENLICYEIYIHDGTLDIEEIVVYK